MSSEDLARRISHLREYINAALLDKTQNGMLAILNRAIQADDRASFYALPTANLDPTSDVVYTNSINDLDDDNNLEDIVSVLGSEHKANTQSYDEFMRVAEQTLARIGQEDPEAAHEEVASLDLEPGTDLYNDVMDMEDIVGKHINGFIKH